MRARTSPNSVWVASLALGGMSSLQIGDSVAQLLDRAGNGPGHRADGAALVFGDLGEGPAVQSLEDDRLGLLRLQAGQRPEQALAPLRLLGQGRRRGLLTRQPLADAGRRPLGLRHQHLLAVDVTALGGEALDLVTE